MKVRKATQYTVCVEDAPGKLAAGTKALAEAGVNLIALAGWTEGEGKGLIACIPEDPDKVRALSGCEEASCQPKESEVVVVEGEDQLGVAAAVAGKVAEAGVNIQSCYMQGIGGKCQAVISVAPEDLDKVVEALSADSSCCCSE